MNVANDSEFVTRKSNIFNDNWKSNYVEGNEIIYNAEVLKCNLCNYNDAYILVIGDITVTAAPGTQVAFKSCAACTTCIMKVDGTTIDDPGDLGLAITMYNLIEYSSKYSEITGSLWFYSKDEAINLNVNIASTDNFKS